MTKMHLLGPAEAVAWGAKISQVDVISHTSHPFPADVAAKLRSISPVAAIENASISAALHSAMGSELGGKRSFVSSSGLLSESLYTAAYMRLPLVVANMSSPIGVFSPKQDHSDIMAMRDSGSLIFMPENHSEAIETIIQAYRVAEEVMLPAVVGVDMKNVYESVMLPNEQFSKRFLGKFSIPFHPNKKPSLFSGPSDHVEFRKQQQKAIASAVPVIEKSSLAWKKKFRKTLPLVEHYKTEDADQILVITGYHSTTAKSAVNKLRSGGKKVGLLRLRILRPWPAEGIRDALQNAKNVAVFDQSISLGNRGLIFNEICQYSRHAQNFISLGHLPSEKDFIEIFARLQKNEQETVWL